MAALAGGGGGISLDPILTLVTSGRSQGYRWKGVLDVIAVLTVVTTSDAPSAAHSVVEWLLGLRATSTADSVAKRLSCARTAAAIFAPHTHAALTHPLVYAALEGMRRTEGPVALVRGAVPVTAQQYRQVVLRANASTWGPQYRAAFTLMWYGAMRFADVAAIREGGLWEVEETVVGVELPVTKTSHVGLPRGLEIAMPRRYLSLFLGPFLVSAPPVARAFDRAPLDIAYGVMSKLIKDTLGAEYTPHSFRKGAVQTLLAKGARVQDIPLLTLHRSLPGLMAYAGGPDAETRATVRALGALLAP